MPGRTLRAAWAAAVLCACSKASTPIVEQSTQPPPAAETGSITVSVSVAGGGLVGFGGDTAGFVSQPPCSSTCRYSVPRQARVRLVPIPQPGTAFASWGGACSGPGDCEFVASHDAEVAALFAAVKQVQPAELSLTVEIGGEGAGAVRVYDAKDHITECSRNCTVTVVQGPTTIASIPRGGAKFAKWAGACSGVSMCRVELSQDSSVRAEFDRVPPAPWRYDWADVTTLDGMRVNPSALADDGSIAGRYTREAEAGVFLWDGALRRFPLPQGASASVAATAGGLVVGSLLPDGASASARRAYVAAQGVIHDLGTLGGDSSWARAVNPAGVVVGGATVAGGETHAFSWRDGLMIDLGTLADKTMSEAFAIDDEGVIYGRSCDGGVWWPPGCHLVRFDSHGPSDLGAIPDGPTLVSMNAAGDALLLGGNGISDALLWHQGVLRDPLDEAELYAWPRIGSLSGGRLSTWSWASNPAGDALVWVSIPISEGEASILVLRHGGEMYDVSDLVELDGLLPSPQRLDYGIAINARGQILAYASRARADKYFLLTPRRLP